MSSLEWQKAYNKEVRAWCIERGLCTICHREKADKGYKTCLVCRMDRREKAAGRTLTDEQKRSKAERRRCTAAEHKAKGLCLQCSKPVFRDHAYCHEHYISQRKADARHRRKKYPYHPSGTCRFCGKEPLPGKKTCETHYPILRDRMLKINEEKKACTMK